MNDFDPDERDRDAGPERNRDARSDPSSIVHLGINVGIQPLSDLFGGVLGVSSSPSSKRSERQSVGDAARTDPEAPTGRGKSERNEVVDVADDYLVDTHREGDEFLVTAELPGVDEDDLSVGIDVESNDLVLSADGRTIERISLPWSSTDAAKVWFNNGILEVRLHPAEGDDGDRDDDG